MKIFYTPAAKANDPVFQNFQTSAYFMRKIYVLVILLCSGWMGVKGQVARYQFSQSTGTYSSITGTNVTFPTSVTAAWDDHVLTTATSLTIPFTFTFNGVGYTSVSVNSNGYVTFGATVSSGNGATTGYTPISTATNFAGAVSAFARDLINGGAAITYTTLNASPNRIFVVQWSNAFRYNSGAVTGDNFNFQIRLYETSNAAEVMYGNCVATSTTGLTSQVGLRGASNADYSNRLSTGAWNASNLGQSNAATMTSSNTSLPASGLTFTWTPASCAIPTGLSVTTPTSSGANFSWTASAPVPTGGYQWKVVASGAGSEGTAVANGTTGAGVTTATLASGLAPSTTYALYVRSNCGSSLSSWNGPASFTTLVAIKPEPTNQPTALTATGVTTAAIVPAWIAAVTGTQAPDGYLIKANNTSLATITDPVDGTDPADVLAFTGGLANKKQTPGTSTTTSSSFTNTAPGTMYYYKAFSYTNTGTAIDFKTNSPATMFNATKPNPATVVSLTATSSSAGTISWTAPASYLSGTNTTLAFVKSGVTAITVGTPTTDPNAYTDNVVFASGTAYQNDALAYCVYKGDGTTVNVTGLAPNTTYQVLVLAVVDGQNSDLTYSYSAGATASGATPCSAITVFPWTEGFESVTSPGVGIYPSCWSYVNVSGSNLPGTTTTNDTYREPRTGTKYAYTQYSNTSWTFTPGFTLNSGVSYDFSFWMRNKEGSTGFNMAVAYGGAASVAGMTTTLRALTAVTNSGWTLFSYTVTPGTSGTFYFGVNVAGNGTPWYLSFDDFRVELTPSCLPPTSITGTATASNAANLSWAAPATAPTNGYQWEVRTSGAGGSGATGLTTSGNTAAGVVTTSTSALSPITTYTLYVRSDCGGTFSTWAASSTFATPAAPMNYDFAQATGTYTPISAANLFTATLDDEVSTAITIPSFTYNGTAYTTMYVSANGWLTLGTTAPTNTTSPLTATTGITTQPVIVPFSADLNYSLSASPSVSWATVGNEIVVQWQDVGQYVSGGSTQRVSFQARLNTVTGEIKFVYGGTISATASYAYQVGLRGNSNTFPTQIINRTNSLTTAVVLALDWAKSTHGNSNSSTMTWSSSNKPDVGLTYTFTPNNCVPFPTPSVATAISDITATANWAAVAAAASGYEIRWRRPSDALTVPTWATPTAVASGTTLYNITGLTASTVYIFEVRSKCGVSSGSIFSNAISFQTAIPACVTPTAQPAALLFPAVTSTSISGSFTAASPAAGKYLVVRSTSATAPVPVSGTVYAPASTALGAGTYVVQNTAALTFTDNTLQTNTSYYYYIFSYNDGCTGAPAYNTTSPLTNNPVATITCPAAPTAPSSSSPTTDGFTINWTASVPGGSAATITYVINVYTDAAMGTNVPGSPFASAVNNYVVSGLNAGTQYWYKITATNGCTSSSINGTATTNSLTPTITSLGSMGGCVGTQIIINGTNLAGAVASGVTIGGTAVTSIVSNTGTVLTAVVGAGTTGVVSVTNSGGTGVGTDVFTVYQLPAVPANPASNSPQCAATGVTLTRTGTPGAGETWYWQTGPGGTTVSAGINDQATFIVNTSGTYYIRSQNSNGCWSNGAGSITVATVSAVPTITTSPANANITAGANATFTVAGSNGPTSYVWEVNSGSGWSTVSNGGVYSNATNASLLLTAPPVSMSGYQYRGYAVNSCGSSLASGIATLTISFCTPTYATGAGTVDYISNVTLGALSNTTGASATPFYTFYGAAAIPDIERNGTASVSVTLGNDPNQFVGVWIDFNQDGIFSASEGAVSANAGANGTVTLSLAVPAGAVLGNTRMRVRGGDDLAMTTAQACGATNSAYGETEDYRVNVIIPSPRTIGTITAVQQTGSVYTASTNNNMLLLNVPVTGGLGTQTITSLNVNSANTLDSDISGVTLWTGTSTAPVTQIGSATFAGSVAAFTGLNVSLATGNNYLWVAYNISATGVDGNTADAKINANNITIVRDAGNIATLYAGNPALDPAGGRPIIGAMCGNSYTINKVLPASATNYISFTAAINDLNLRGISCGVTFNVKDGQTFDELTPNITTTGTASNPIIFQRDNSGPSAPILRGTTGTGVNDAIIQLNKVDYLTWDGINLIDNPANTTDNRRMEVGIYLKGGAGDGCKNNVFKNMTISLSATNSNISVGVWVVSAATNAGGTNSNNKFYNIQLSNAAYGYLLYGSSPAQPDNGNEINTSGVGISSISNIGSAALTYGEAVGVNITYQTSLVIKNTTITNLAGSTGGILKGIQSAFGPGNTLDIQNNTISGLSVAGNGSASYGIHIVEGASSIISNNTIKAVSAAGFYAFGIYVQGSTSLVANGNTIGATGAANAITSARGGGLVSGIYATSTVLTPEIKNNTLTNIGVTGANASQVLGINVGSPGAVITGNNLVSIFSNGNSATIPQIGICASSTATGAVIRTNTINGISCTNNADIIGIYAVGNNADISVNNAISNLASTGDAYVYGIETLGSGSTVSNNTVSALSSTGFQEINGISLEGSANTANANSVSNLTSTTAAICGIYGYAPNAAITGNTISTLTGGSSTVWGIYIDDVTQSVLNNSITNISGALSTFGVYSANTSVSSIITGNIIRNNTVTAGASSLRVNGIYLEGTGTNIASYNNIDNLINNGASTNAQVSGIRAVGTGTYRLFNNMISKLTANASTFTGAAVRGISIENTAIVKAYNNTVYLSGTATATSFESGAFYTNSVTAGSLDLRNNIFYNVYGGTGKHAAINYIGTTTDYANLLAATSNNNLLFGGISPGASNLIFKGSSGNEHQTIANYLANAAGKEPNSFTVTSAVPFTEVSTLPSNLHINNTGANLCAISKKGVAITTGNSTFAITDDIDNDLRQSPPDVGADEWTLPSPNVGTIAASASPACGAAITINGTGVSVGSDFTYQWQVNPGTGFVNISDAGIYTGSTTAILSISNTTGLNGYRYQLITNRCSPATAAFSTTLAITLNVLVPSVAPTAAAADKPSVCPGTKVTLTKTGGTLGAGGSYNWYNDPSFNAINLVGTTTDVNATLDVFPTVSTTYYLRIENSTSPCAPAPTSSVSVAVNVKTPFTWLGNNSDWTNTGNWCNGTLPDATTNVFIPAGSMFYPVLTTGVTARAKDITIAAGSASLIIDAGAVLEVYGSVNNNAVLTNNGTIVLAGNTLQSFPGPGTIGLTGDMANLKIINTNAGVKLNKSFGITNQLIPASGNLELDAYDITIRSSATGTASVSALGATAGFTYGGSGRFVVERFINTGVTHGRSWQFLAVPTTKIPFGTEQTINNAWQEQNAPGGNLVAGFGTRITSPNFNNVGSGFDDYTAGPGMKSFSDITQNWDMGPATTGASVVNPKGWMIFIRGDRTVTGTNTGTPFRLRTRGALLTNDQVYTFGQNKLLSVGNPYASAVDLRSVSKTNVTSDIYIWDPTLGGNFGLGGYRVLTYFPAQNHYRVVPPGGIYPGPFVDTIQSGQAFFVKSNGVGTSSSITFKETDKVNEGHLVTRGGNGSVQLLGINISRAEAGGNTTLLDGTLAAFGSEYSREVTAEDGTKFMNAGENTGLRRSAKLLSVERLPEPEDADTLHLDLIAAKQSVAYNWEFLPENMDMPGRTAWLVDRYLKTSTPIDLTGNSSITFTVDGNTSSSATDRFKIVFKIAAPLPVTITSIAATRNPDRSIKVKWSVENELNLDKYEIERSADGIHFSGIITTAVTASRHYAKDDLSPLAQDNYYRIKAISNNGQIQYSAIVKVAPLKSNGLISIYPNPVEGKIINLRFADMAEGSYQLILTNKLGQVLYSGTANVTAASFVKNITLSKLVTAGTYQMKVVDADGKSVDIKIIIN